MRAWLARAAFAAVVGANGVALACPVCFSAKDEAQRQAFFDTTIFLTLLPLALIGGIAYWIFKRSVSLAAEEAAETSAAAADEAAEPPQAPPSARAAAPSR
jgi:hypothetical protein